MTPPPMPQTVRAAFEHYPEAARAPLMGIRALIFEEAETRAIGPLTETLKWGEPAYLTVKKAGTTIRLAWKAKAPDVVQMLVHCNTSLIDRWRSQFAELRFAGNRALHLPIGPIPEAALRQMIGQALTYHRAA